MSKTTKTLLLLFNAFCYVCYLTVGYLHFMYYNAMQEALMITNTEIGIVGLGTGIMAITAYFIGGAMADSFSAKKMLSVGHFICAGLAFIYASLPSFTVVLIIMIVAAFFLNGTLWSGAAKMVREFSTAENEAKMYGVYLAFAGIGGTIFGLSGAYLIGQLGSAEGVSTILYIVGGYMAFAGVINLVLYKESTGEQSSTSEDDKFKMVYLKEILRNPNFWLLSISGAMIYPISAAISYFAPLLHSNYGVSLALVSVVGTFRYYIARMIFAPVGGMLVQKKGSIWVMKLVIILALACSVFILIMPMNSTMLLPAVAIVIILCVIYNTSTTTWYTSVNDIGIPAHMKGTAIGLYCGLIFHSDIYLYTICGVILDSYESHTAYQIIYSITGGMFLVGLITLVILGQRLKAAAKLKTTTV